MFPPTYTTCNCCCVTFVSLFINLRHPQYFMSHTSRRGTFYEYIEMRIFGPSEFFCSSGRGSFLVIWAPWHAGRPPGPHTQVWAMAEVRPTCSRGPKSQVPPGGIPSTWSHPAACRPTYRLHERPTAHVVYGILNVINVVGQFLLRPLLPPTPTGQTCDHF